MSDIILSTFLLPVAGRQALNLELSFETQSSTGTFFEALKAIYIACIWNEECIKIMKYRNKMMQ